VADIDAAFMQQVLDIPKRKRKPYIHHNGQANDLGARLELAEGAAAFGHPERLSGRPARLNKFSSDSAVRPALKPKKPRQKLFTTPFYDTLSP
jgi:hypothetical protein